jgi:cytochrome c oxidase subunit 1
MAMTETRPEATAAVEPAASAADGGDVPQPASGLAGILGSVDHHVIGRLWIVTSVVMLGGAGLLGVLLGVERLKTSTYDVFEGRHYLQFFSLHAVAATYLFAIPLLIGVATVVVPRQLGARTIAFPRAAALAYWAYLIGGALLVVSFAINGGPGGTRASGISLFLASLGLVTVALVLASVCLATTVLALRPAGMRLDRVPAFSWSILVATSIWIVSLGFLVGELVLLYLDSRYQVGALIGQSEDIARWLYWTTTPPQVFAFAIPVLGFVADVVPVAARRPLRHRGAVLAAIAAFGGVSFGAWTFAGFEHPELYKEFLFVAAATGALPPILIVLGAVGETAAKGKPKPSSPLLFGIASLLMLGAGVAAGALRSFDSFKLVGTTADASVAHYALGAAALAGFGALHYWWPQILRRPLNEALGRTTALLALLGTIALALPDLISGFLDEPRGSIPTSAPFRDGVELLNAISLAGGALLILAVLLLVLNLARSLAKRPEEGAPDHPIDPWDGHTLEWAGDPEAIAVTSATPLYDLREER